jgi:hypothetical protein
MIRSGPVSASMHEVSGPMSDLIYLAAGIAILAVFGGYAAILRRL